MSFVVGSGSSCQFGKEATFGTKATMTGLVNLTSESLKVNVEKGDEGSLLASKTAMSRDILGITVDGSVSFILRPEFAGLLFHAALGGADVVADAASVGEGFKTHTINLCDVNEDLPTLTITVDRKAATKAYTGCSISSLSLDCAAGDYVKGSFDIKGYKEETGTLAELESYTLPSYRCTSATFKVHDESYCITSASFKVDNALVDAPKTYCSGVYSGQPQHGQRAVTIDFEIPYEAKIETLKDDYLLTEDNASVELVFTSRDEKYSVKITMPNVAISNVTTNVGGTGIINSSVSGIALSVGDVEPVTVVITDKEADPYSN